MQCNKDENAHRYAVRGGKDKEIKRERNRVMRERERERERGHYNITGKGLHENVFLVYYENSQCVL